MNEELIDKLALRELVDNWAIWRDAGFWDKFRTVWHDDGRMMATWTQGTADEFIEMNKQDVVCTGRFYDFLEKRDGRWGMCLRQPIYEKDRMDPIEPNAAISLDQSVLDEFPSGYQHLAYLQSQVGYPVKKDMPGLKGKEVEALYATGANWLAGNPIAWAGHSWG